MNLVQDKPKVVNDIPDFVRKVNDHDKDLEALKKDVADLKLAQTFTMTDIAAEN